MSEQDRKIIQQLLAVERARWRMEHLETRCARCLTHLGGPIGGEYIKWEICPRCRLKQIQDDRKWTFGNWIIFGVVVYVLGALAALIIWGLTALMT
jgi:hypothetical protein